MKGTHYLMKGRWLLESHPQVMQTSQTLDRDSGMRLTQEIHCYPEALHDFTSFDVRMAKFPSREFRGASVEKSFVLVVQYRDSEDSGSNPRKLSIHFLKVERFSK